MTCPNCGSNDIFDSELGGDDRFRCNECLHWFTPSEIPPEVLAVHDEARGVGETVGAEGSPFFVNPAMLPKDALDARTEEQLEAEEESWRGVRDNFLQVPIVNGSELPKFEVILATCEAGCHIYVGVADEANQQGYLTGISNMPAFIAQMQGVIDFNGNLNPTIERAELIRLQSALN